MSELLGQGQMIPTDSGGTCRVEKFLGGGGQGEVYQASWEGKDYALKWYFPETANPKQLQALQALVQKGRPSARFLWPIELVSSGGPQGFGYLMPLPQAHF